MPKPVKRTRVRVITDGLSRKSGKAVKSFLRRTIERDLKTSGSTRRPRSGFPKQGTIVASGFGKHLGDDSGFAKLGPGSGRR
jgi:hypothetical protein